jgi:hypothetical protein
VTGLKSGPHVRSRACLKLTVQKYQDRSNSRYSFGTHWQGKNDRNTGRKVFSGNI